MPLPEPLVRETRELALAVSPFAPGGCGARSTEGRENHLLKLSTWPSCVPGGVTLPHRDTPKRPLFSDGLFITRHGSARWLRSFPAVLPQTAVSCLVHRLYGVRGCRSAGCRRLPEPACGEGWQGPLRPARLKRSAFGSAYRGPVCTNAEPQTSAAPPREVQELKFEASSHCTCIVLLCVQIQSSACPPHQHLLVVDSGLALPPPLPPPLCLHPLPSSSAPLHHSRSACQGHLPRSLDSLSTLPRLVAPKQGEEHRRAPSDSGRGRPPTLLKRLDAGFWA